MYSVLLCTSNYQIVLAITSILKMLVFLIILKFHKKKCAVPDMNFLKHKNIMCIYMQLKMLNYKHDGNIYHYFDFEYSNTRHIQLCTNLRSIINSCNLTDHKTRINLAHKDIQNISFPSWFSGMP